MAGCFEDRTDGVDMRRRVGWVIGWFHDRAELSLDGLELLDPAADISKLILSKDLQVLAGARSVGVERDQFADGIEG